VTTTEFVSASIFLSLVTVGIRAFDLMRGEVVRFASDGIESERISSIARDRQIGAALREMASVLHGTVQTKLMTCAMALDLAAQSGDDESANTALLEARRVLGAASFSPSEDAGSLRGEIARKCAVWNGLCESSIHIDVRDESSDVIERIARIVEEGIANAVRHGGATKVELSVIQDLDGAFEVSVRDNGDGQIGGSPGVGSSIIDYASGGAWSLDGTPDGTVLTAHVHPYSAG
jgi:signal transduction histidine kinase